MRDEPVAVPSRRVKVFTVEGRSKMTVYQTCSLEIEAATANEAVAITRERCENGDVAWKDDEWDNSEPASFDAIDSFEAEDLADAED